jgi:hypothetical protein
VIKRSWSEDEDQVIREFGPTVSVQRLAVRLKRRNSSVVARAKVLDVKLTNPKRLKQSECSAFNIAR